MLKRRSVLAGTAGLTIVGASAVRAQAWPNGPVKIVVPYIPGGATDTAGRLVAEKMTALLGQQVIVENRGGGNTIIGMELVAKSKPDGQTLLLGTTTLATNAALGLKQPYEPLKDFQPISTLADIPDLIAYNNDVPAKNWAEFADWVNKQPQKVRFAHVGHRQPASSLDGAVQDPQQAQHGGRGLQGRGRRHPRRAGGPRADDLRRRAADRQPRQGRAHEGPGRCFDRALAGVPGRADGGRARHARHGERGVLRPGGAGRRAAADRRPAERARSARSSTIPR